MSEQEMLLRRLNALDFAIWELHIFLDTHPCDQAALARHEDLTHKRIVLAERYREQFGPPDRNEGASHWDWVNSPWPWESDFTGGVK